jgi:hypothetical protein
LHAFVKAFHVVFLSAAPVTAIGFVLVLFLREVPLRTGHAVQEAKEEAAGEMFG